MAEGLETTYEKTIVSLVTVALALLLVMTAILLHFWYEHIYNGAYYSKLRKRSALPPQQSKQEDEEDEDEEEER
jgi:hypothetical protein